MNMWEEITNDIKKKKELFSKNLILDKDKLKVTDNLHMSQLKIGGHKHYGKLFEGSKIIFYIKREKQILLGDKLCNRYGGKGLITHIIPKDETPYSEITNKKIDIFISPIGVLGRKSIAIIKELYIGKIIIALKEQIKEYIKHNIESFDNLKKIILDVYSTLDPTSDKKYTTDIKNNLNSFNETSFKKSILNDEFKFILIVEPFNNIPMESIQKAAEILSVPLDERVFIPALNCWTKTKVPVGVAYINCMEQFAEDYETLRSSGSYNMITGQPRKGGHSEGGSSQSIGGLDTYALLSYDCPKILAELMTVRSDDYISKRKVVTNIIQNGNSDLPTDIGQSTTHQLFKLHMIAMGLDYK